MHLTCLLWVVSFVCCLRFVSCMCYPAPKKASHLEASTKTQSKSDVKSDIHYITYLLIQASFSSRSANYFPPKPSGLSSWNFLECSPHTIQPHQSSSLILCENIFITPPRPYGSRVTAILLNGWIWPNGGDSAMDGLRLTGATPSIFFFIIFFLICIGLILYLLGHE